MAQANINAAVRQNSPYVLSPNCYLLFLDSLMNHPFDESFYYGENMSTPCRVPNGVKAIRTANALARINVADFHMRNGSVGRLWTLNTMENLRRRLFDMYGDDKHGDDRHGDGKHGDDGHDGDRQSCDGLSTG